MKTSADTEFNLSVDKDPDSTSWTVSINKTRVGRVIELGPNRYTTTTADDDQEHPDPIKALYALVGPDVADILRTTFLILDQNTVDQASSPLELFDGLVQQVPDGHHDED